MIKTLLLTICFFALTLNVFAGNYPAIDRNFTDSPFKGQFSGSFTGRINDGNEQSGKLTISIKEDGEITGKFENFTSGTTASCRGFINEDGEVTLTYKYPYTFGTLKGIVTKTRNGHLKGVLSQREGNETVATVEIDLLSK